MHDRYYVKAEDNGVCEFCGQPIEMYDEPIFVRLKDEDESRIAHEECFEEYKQTIPE